MNLGEYAGVRHFDADPHLTGSGNPAHVSPNFFRQSLRELVFVAGLSNRNLADAALSTVREVNGWLHGETPPPTSLYQIGLLADAIWLSPERENRMDELRQPASNFELSFAYRSMQSLADLERILLIPIGYADQPLFQEIQATSFFYELVRQGVTYLNRGANGKYHNMVRDAAHFGLSETLESAVYNLQFRVPIRSLPRDGEDGLYGVTSHPDLESFTVDPPAFNDRLRIRY